MAETIEDLRRKLILYEQNGAAKLYYSLNRKMNEMADMLNKQNLANLDLTDPKDKSFERLKIVWNDAANIATAVKLLGETAGVTGNEEEDIDNAKHKKHTTPESVADVLGHTAGNYS